MSVMPFRRALLSAITLFGGHFLNRRLDRVVLIGTLLAAATVASIGVPVAHSFIGEPNFRFVTWALRLPLILVGAIALLSAGLTFGDAQRAPGGPLTATIRVTRLPLTLFGLLMVAAVFALVALSRYMYPPMTESPPQPTEFLAPAAAGRLHFGGDAVAGFLPAPPSGPERLRGRITLNGVGVAGAGLSLMLNSRYKVQHLDSDSRGVFEVPLPAGEWHVNEIVVSDWDGRPKDRDLILFSSHEPVKDEGQYSRLNVPMADGLEVSLPAASNTIPVEIEFRDALLMNWPPRPNSSGDGPGRESLPDAEFSTDAIAWQPVKGATEYEVQIGHAAREGRMTYSSPILTRRLSGLSLPLASLPQRSASALVDEYSVHVFAFDAEGHLLTESNLESADRRFKLTGATRLGREREYVGGGGSPEVISAEYESNDLRLDLAAKLLDQRRLDDARRVLEQVTKDAPRGHALVVRGRLAALQGDCVTAIRLFDKAESEGECAPLEDRKLCEAPQN